MQVSEKAARLRGLLKQAVPATPQAPKLGDMPQPGAGAGAGAMSRPTPPRPTGQPSGAGLTPPIKPATGPSVGQTGADTAMQAPSGRPPGMIPYTSTGGTRMLGSAGYLAGSPDEARTVKPGDLWTAAKEQPGIGDVLQGGENLVNRYRQGGFQQLGSDVAGAAGGAGQALTGLADQASQAVTPQPNQGAQAPQGDWGKAWQALTQGNFQDAWGQTPQWGKWGLGIGGGMLLLMLLSKLFGKGASLDNYTDDERGQAQDLLDRMMKRAGLAQAPRYSRTGYGANPAGKFVPGNQFQGSATKAMPRVRQTGADAAIGKMAANGIAKQAVMYGGGSFGLNPKYGPGLELGYSNLFGLVPVPTVGLDIGGPQHGLTVGGPLPYIGARIGPRETGAVGWRRNFPRGLPEVVYDAIQGRSRDDVVLHEYLKRLKRQNAHGRRKQELQQAVSDAEAESAAINSGEPTEEPRTKAAAFAVKLAMKPSMMVRIRQRRIIVAPRHSPSVRASDNKTPSTNDMAKSKDRKGDFAVT